MARSFRKVHPPPGARPGTLAVPPNSPPPRVSVLRYDEKGVEKLETGPIASLATHVRPGAVTWIDVQGLGDERTLRAIGNAFDIHPLALEDIANVPQRPKADEYDGHLVLITRMAQLNARGRLAAEQVAIFVGEQYVLTFQEAHGDVLDPVRRRIDEGVGPIRMSGSAYLAYAVLDAIIDGYYPVVEALSDEMERVESQIIAAPAPRHLDQVNRLRADLMKLRRGLWPQRDTLNTLMREDTSFLPEAVKLYLRDTLDHCAQLTDIVDTQRELANGLLNTYLSVVAHRTNEVMKVLTIMASIFIPLTFVAGIYGMNFDYMPELHREDAYPTVLIVMVIIAGGMLFYFRRKGWIGGMGAPDDDT